MNSGWAPGFIKNAGWNLMEVPRAFNHWMGAGMSNHVLRLMTSTLVKADLMGSYAITQWMFGLQEPSTPDPQMVPQNP